MINAEITGTPKETLPIKPEIEQLLAAPLGADDIPWMSKVANRDIDATDLSHVELLRKLDDPIKGSKWDEQTREDIKTVRNIFYKDILGLENENHPLHHPYNVARASRNEDYFHPTIDNLIGTQRLYEHYGVDSSKLFKHAPLAAFMYTPEKVGTTLAAMEDNNLNPESILSRIPAAISFPAEKIPAKIAYLEDLGINAVAAINKAPNVLRKSEESIAKRMELFTSLGLNGSKIINEMPAIIGLSDENLIHRYSTIEHILSTFGAQTSANELLNAKPILFTYSKDKLMAAARLLADHGTPELLDDDPTAIARLASTPLDTFVAEIDAADNSEDITLASLKKRERTVKGSERREEAHAAIDAGKLSAKAIAAYRKATK